MPEYLAVYADGLLFQRGMVRKDPHAPHVRTIAVHVALDNEVVNLINKTYNHPSKSNKTPSHQGCLTH